MLGGYQKPNVVPSCGTEKLPVFEKNRLMTDVAKPLLVNDHEYDEPETFDCPECKEPLTDRRFELCDECEAEYQADLIRNHEAPGMSEA